MTLEKVTTFGDDSQLYKPQQVAVEKALSVIRPGVAKLAAEVDGATITPDTFGPVTDLYSRIRAGLKSVDKARTDITGKLNAQKREIDGLFRPWTEQLETLSKQISDALGEYNRLAREAQARAQAEERARQEREEQERDLAVKAAWDAGKPLEEVAEAAEPASLLDVQTAPVRQAPVLGAVKRSRTDSATVTMVEVWKYEVEDAGAVPREYLAIDESAIGAAVRGGTREIPGVRIYSVEEPRARRR